MHHTDAGSQYLAVRYANTLSAAGAVASVGSVGDSYDNALAESSSSWSSPSWNTSTGGTTAGYTARSA